LIEGAGGMILTHQADQIPLHLQLVGERGDEPRLQSHLRRIAVRRAHRLRQRVDVALDGPRRELPRLHHRLLVARPEDIEVSLALLLVGRGHVVAREDLDRALERADPEDIDVDADLLQQTLEVERVAAVSLDHHVTGGIEVDLVGLGREVELILIVCRAVGDDGLAAGAERADGGRELLELRLAGALHLVEAEHQDADAAIGGGTANGAHKIPERRLLALISLGVLDRPLDGVAAQLLHQAPLRLHDERGALRHARHRGADRPDDRAEDDDEQDEVQDLAQPVEATPDPTQDRPQSAHGTRCAASDLLFDSRCLARKVPQVIELRAADVAPALDGDVADGGAVGLEHALHTLAVRHLAHREGGIQAAVAAGDHHALIGLDALAVALDDLHLHDHGVARLEIRHLAGHALFLELLDDLAHFLILDLSSRAAPAARNSLNSRCASGVTPWRAIRSGRRSQVRATAWASRQRPMSA